MAAGKHISVSPKKQAGNTDASQVVKDGKEYFKASTLGPHDEIHIREKEGNVQCGELKAFTWPFNRELSRSWQTVIRGIKECVMDSSMEE